MKKYPQKIYYLAMDLMDVLKIYLRVLQKKIKKF